jgi:hypothetical protein
MWAALLHVRVTIPLASGDLDGSASWDHPWKMIGEVAEPRSPGRAGVRPVQLSVWSREVAP